MTATRPSHQASPVAAALAELERCSGTRYDPRVVAAFLQVVAMSEQEGIPLPPALCAVLEESTRKSQIDTVPPQSRAAKRIGE
jgi:hypothetical protein